MSTEINPTPDRHDQKELKISSLLVENPDTMCEHLDMMHAAFIRDNVSGNFHHKIRVEVLETYLAVSYFLKQIEA